MGANKPKFQFREPPCLGFAAIAVLVVAILTAAGVWFCSFSLRPQGFKQVTVS